MTDEPQEQRMYTIEQVVAIADAWADLNYWLGKLRAYNDRGGPTDQEFHFDRPALEQTMKKIPYDICRILEERGYSEEIIQELSKQTDEFDPEVSDEEFRDRYGQKAQ